jgi:hypothetical protein
MTPTEIEAALREAFGECEAIGYPLEAVQKQVLLQALIRWIESQTKFRVEQGGLGEDAVLGAPKSTGLNPLEELTLSQRQVLLHFIQTQAQENRSWKAQLLNDWLNNRDSGDLQFIRQSYGLQWLEQVQPVHIAQYAGEVLMPLQVGDRIEVSNSLWEWVQADIPDGQEWFLCTVISVTEPAELQPDSGDRLAASCTIRFDNGMEYEIQGIYEWNRYNWRRSKERNGNA